MPEKPRPRRGLSPGSAARLRSSRPVEPKVPAGEHHAIGAHLAVGLRDGVEQVLGMAVARGQVLAVAHAPAVAVAVQRRAPRSSVRTCAPASTAAVR